MLVCCYKYCVVRYGSIYKNDNMGLTDRYVLCITSDSDSVAEAAGLRVQVKRRQTGHFVFFAGHAPSETVLIQRAASTSSASPRSSSSSTRFCAESEV